MSTCSLVVACCKESINDVVEETLWKPFGNNCFWIASVHNFFCYILGHIRQSPGGNKVDGAVLIQRLKSRGKHGVYVSSMSNDSFSRGQGSSVHSTSSPCRLPLKKPRRGRILFLLFNLQRLLAVSRSIVARFPSWYASLIKTKPYPHSVAPKAQSCHNYYEWMLHHCAESSLMVFTLMPSHCWWFCILY